MEGLREQLVKRPSYPEDMIKKIIIILSSVTLAIVIIGALRFISGIWLLTELGILIGIGIVWGGIWLAGRLNVEYEYIIADGEMQIDKIYNKRSRKSLISFKLRSAEAFSRGQRDERDASEIDVRGEGECYSIVFSDAELGKAVLWFTPDERTLEAITPYLPKLS